MNSPRQYRPQAGDIFACYGTDLISRGISIETSLTSWLTGPNGLRLSPSHVAMASHRLAPDDSDHFWFESTSLSGRQCLEAERPVAGVQVHRIRDRILDYVRPGGHVDVYRLTKLDELRIDEQTYLRHYLMQFAGSAVREPTCYDTAGAIFSGTRILRRLPFSRANLEQLFCSEFLAAVLQRLCRMTRDNPAKYDPGRLMRSLVRQGTYLRHCSFTSSAEVAC